MKDLKISNFLLADVLNWGEKECLFYSGFILNKNTLEINLGELGIEEINIYEFAFKCKEWAYKNRYDIWSITWGVVEFQNNDKYNGTERITEDTEIEAIIKACTHILNSISNK